VPGVHRKSCGKINVHVRFGIKDIGVNRDKRRRQILPCQPLCAGVPVPLRVDMVTYYKKLLFVFLNFIFFVSVSLFVFSEEPSHERLIIDHKPAPKPEINLSEFDYGFDLPILSGNKEPVTHHFNCHKFSFFLNSTQFRNGDYKRYFFIFSSYLRNKHFILGEHSSLRAPPYTV
jgi:hypothetical protein